MLTKTMGSICLIPQSPSKLGPLNQSKHESVLFQVHKVIKICEGKNTDMFWKDLVFHKWWLNILKAQPILKFYLHKVLILLSSGS